MTKQTLLGNIALSLVESGMLERIEEERLKRKELNNNLATEKELKNGRTEE